MMNDDASFRVRCIRPLSLLLLKKKSLLSHDFTKSTFLWFVQKTKTDDKKREKKSTHQKKLLTKFSKYQREREREREDEDEEEEDKR